jgi:hypothetical protein
MEKNGKDSVERLGMESLTREIPLTEGFIALVDEDDYEKAISIRWYLEKRVPWTPYAMGHPLKHDRQKTIRMHRFIMDAKQGQVVDHINGNGLDNRKENLRFCTLAQNHFNQVKTRGVSKYKGVYWHKPAKKWCANIHYNGKTTGLGLFIDEDDAARAYDTVAKELFGEFANLNFEEVYG